MVGASFTSVTAMLKAGSAAVSVPSVTEITIPDVVLPTSALPGVPVKAPVAASKVAHAGFVLLGNRIGQGCACVCICPNRGETVGGAFGHCGGRRAADGRRVIHIGDGDA